MLVFIYHSLNARTTHLTKRQQDYTQNELRLYDEMTTCLLSAAVDNIPRTISVLPSRIADLRLE